MQNRVSSSGSDAIANNTTRGSALEEHESGASKESQLKRQIPLFLAVVFLLFFASCIGIWCYFAVKTTQSSSNALSFLPPSFPLAVRSPYLHAWLPGTSVESFATSRAQFWDGTELGWSIAARVNGQTYSLFGDPKVGDPATLEGSEFTSTNSLFTLSAGGVRFCLDFFSPVSPKNYIRQSLPFSYLTVTLNATHSDKIQIYSDINSAWTGARRNDKVSWLSASELGVTRFEVQRTHQEGMFGHENHNMAMWGLVVYATQENNSTLTRQSGNADVIRKQFTEEGTLRGTQDEWSHLNRSVVAFCQDLNTTADKAAVTFAIGHVRNNTINYLGDFRTGYYRSQYPTVSTALKHFFDDYADARTEAVALDESLKAAASGISDQYSDIVTLSLRQAFGAIEITVPASDPNDTSDPLAFIKEISSNGNLNTLLVIYSAHPVYLVTNPELIRLLLEPELRYLASGRWPHQYILHDMGTHYPLARGHDNGRAEPMPIDVSATLPIFGLAYQRYGQERDWPEKYKKNITDAAKYIKEHGWYPALQLATTDAAGKSPNQTVLAIKAAIGMVAYAELFPDADDADMLRENGTALAKALYMDRLGTDPDGQHWTQTYNDPNSWMGAYNLYPDRQLNLSVFPDEAYEMQNNFLPQRRKGIGVPLDSRVNWTKTDWNMWISAVSSDKVRDMYVEDIHNYLGNRENTAPFADRYAVYGQQEGHYILTRARPTVGAHFSLLAMRGVKLFG